MNNIIVQTMIDHPEAFIQWLLALFVLFTGACTAAVKCYKYVEKYRSLRNSLDQKENMISELEKNQTKLNTSVDLMMTSIRNIIKAQIVREYNYFIHMGCIDIYSLDCVERLYQSYTDLDGNTYISDLINKLRELPNHLPEE